MQNKHAKQQANGTNTTVAAHGIEGSIGPLCQIKIGKPEQIHRTNAQIEFQGETIIKASRRKVKQVYLYNINQKVSQRHHNTTDRQGSSW
jgi:hypothetical protein